MTNVSTLAARSTLVLSLIVALAAPGLVAGAPLAATDDVRVLVQAGALDRSASLVAAHGGVVETRLPLIEAVAATVSPRVADLLAEQEGVTVTPDVEVDFASTMLEAPPAGDLQLQAINPPAHWSDATGSGVSVALIDTGVADVPALEGRVIRAVDYTDENDGIDRYGHGTFMAGLIAADGSRTPDGTSVYGVAPGARIVSLKVAGADGVTHLSTLLDAIGWVVVNQDEYGIRVLSLSVAVSLPMAPVADPLAQAVEAAWASGITVVVAAGNDGAEGVSSPGHSPWVLTVGASDTAGTAPVADDSPAPWSSRGRVMGRQKPDVLAPGVSTISLRASGSFVDEGFPEARVGEHHFRGSGTSMSTALVAGAAAALVELRPHATPDDVKAALTTTGQPVEGSAAGVVDLAAADAAEPTSAWRQRHPIGAHGPDGRRLRVMPFNERDAASPNETWQRLRWLDGQWERLRWLDGEWERLRWLDGEWERLRWLDSEWERLRWLDGEWERLRWLDANLARLRWLDAGFARLRWAEQDWARARWVRSEWSRLRWLDESFARLRWVDASWTASNWSSMSAP